MRMTTAQLHAARRRRAVVADSSMHLIQSEPEESLHDSEYEESMPSGTSVKRARILDDSDFESIAHVLLGNFQVLSGLTSEFLCFMSSRIANS